jgi:predicted metal-dependent phosphoesterase TrpH
VTANRRELPTGDKNITAPGYLAGRSSRLMAAWRESMRQFQTDLHIHTVLSPCASDEMTPRAIVEAARLAGLDMIAICDHNSSRNTPAAIQAAAGSVVVIPGIELETCEKIHVLGLFPDCTHALDASDEVRLTLPEIDDQYSRKIGIQILIAPDGAAKGTETKALAASSAFDLRSAVQLIQKHHGLAIAAHVERPSFSVYSQLGDVPRDVPFDALEVSPVNRRPIGLREKFARYGWPLVASSDSHYLSELGRARSCFCLENPTFEEISLALRGQGGRSVTYA